MRILVLGAGRMGVAIVHDLLRCGARVGVADSRSEALRQFARRFGRARLALHRLDAADERATARLLANYNAAASALPYWQNLPLARAAIRARVGFCDLGGSHAIRKAQQRLDRRARRAGVAIIPDCGLAPGLSSVLVAHGARAFARLDSIRMYVGGLPQRPKPPLNYSLYFSPDGLINEYCEPVEVVRGGKRRILEPLAELEAFRFAGMPPLEAFTTSGGSSTLPRTFRGVRELEEKTIRYRGHCKRVRVLAALGLFSSEPVRVGGRTVRPRDVLGELLVKTLPANDPDIVLVRVVLAGRTQRGRRRKLIYEARDRYDRHARLTAMMRTTAYSASVAAQWLAQGRIRPGVHSPEAALPPEEFLQEMRRRGIRVRRRWAR